MSKNKTNWFINNVSEEKFEEFYPHPKESVERLSSEPKKEEQDTTSLHIHSPEFLRQT